MKYDIKLFEEIGWGVLVAVVTYLGTELAATDLKTIDPAAFAVALASGAGRVALAVIINGVRRVLTGS